MSGLVARNCWRTRGCVSPQMSESELAAITVPVSAGAAHLQDVFRREGCALVTGVLTSEECARLEELWKRICSASLTKSKISLQVLLRCLAAFRKKAAEHGLRRGVRCWGRRVALPSEAHHSLTHFLIYFLTRLVPSSFFFWQLVSVGENIAWESKFNEQGLPHGAFAWAARLHPNVRRVFAELFGVVAEELAVGLDVPFWKASDTIFRQDTNPQWLHVDQNHATGLTHMCAQGVLYVWPSTDDNASTTALWPRSHTDTYTRLMRGPRSPAAVPTVFG